MITRCYAINGFPKQNSHQLHNTNQFSNRCLTYFHHCLSLQTCFDPPWCYWPTFVQELWVEPVICVLPAKSCCVWSQTQQALCACVCHKIKCCLTSPSGWNKPIQIINVSSCCKKLNSEGSKCVSRYSNAKTMNRNIPTDTSQTTFGCVSTASQQPQKHLMTLALTSHSSLSILINGCTVFSSQRAISFKSNVPDWDLEGLNFSVHSLERAGTEAIKTSETDGVHVR